MAPTIPANLAAEAEKAVRGSLGGAVGVAQTLSSLRGGTAAPILTNDDWGTQTGGAAAVTAIRQANYGVARGLDGEQAATSFDDDVPMTVPVPTVRSCARV